MTAPREDEPRRVEAYLDALLTAHEPLPAAEPRLTRSFAPFAPRLPALDDPRIAAAATALHTSLVRFHPSFRFEDRLAARLRAAARGEIWLPNHAPARPSLVETTGATVISFPGATTGPRSATDPDHARGLLLGGAIASGVSIAGAALLAWRRQRGSRSRTGIA